MVHNHPHIPLLPLLVCLLTAVWGCTADELTEGEATSGTFALTSSVCPFIGEGETRVNVEGTDFVTGDLIRMRVICPFVTSTQLRESTYGDSYDAFWLLKWNGSGWGQVTAADGFDINGDLYASNAPYIIGTTMGQQTPYVFTASTWTDEVYFVEKNSDNPVISFSNVFHADQRHIDDYRASDVLWAQQFMETACWNLHLTFYHKMAALRVTIDDTLYPISDPNLTTLSLEGMPDIDKQEIIIGDYYAAKSKVNSAYGYKQKNACSYENNGNVLGVAIYYKNTRTAACLPFSSITDKCTYYAYHLPDTKTYLLIVPPIAIPNDATLWFRNDQQRFKVALNPLAASQLIDATTNAPVTAFQSGHLYNLTMKLTAPVSPTP